MKKILVVDDEKDICMLLNRFLTKHNFSVKTALSGAEGIKLLSKETFDLVINDFKLPDFNGLEMLQKIKSLNPKAQVILITGYSDVRIAVQALKKGAFDYVTKPLFPDELLHTVKSALSKGEKNGEAAKSSKQNQAAPTKKPAFILGQSPQATLVQKHIALIAPTDMTVMILGETGTGKEYTAQEIHAKSNRAKHPFLAVDCGALPNELAGSELFGHKKGSFTGAIKDKKGCFEIAKNGTLFLDEIGNLSYENQVKLLRVLQEREVKPLGSDKAIPVDVRVIVATNENVQEAISEGEFREDLYHRINEFKIEMAPLRHRQDDIEIFAKHFLDEANLSLEKEVKGFSSEALVKLKKHAWPGNLRELKNVVKRSVLLCQKSWIEPHLLPVDILNTSPLKSVGNEDSHLPKSLKEAAQMAEKKAILQALNQTQNNKSKAAQLLQIDRKTLYNKMSDYNINV